jgi:hypothetical protein
MELAYFPFTGESYKPQMGLRPLDLAKWIEVCPKRPIHLELKKTLLQKHRSQVLSVDPKMSAAILELREKLFFHLCEQHGLQLGELPTDSDPELALEQLALWTQEDWCLLDEQNLLQAACVCFPSRWDLREKVGKGSDAIHEHVPHFASIAQPALNFFDRLSVEKPMWRLNWTIHDSDQLFCPGPMPPKEGIHVDNVLDRTFLRMERQTLSRLPTSKAIVFSIRTHLYPTAAVATDTERREKMLASLLGLDEATARYRGIWAFLEPLKEALRQGI